MPRTDPFKEGISFNGGLFCKRDLGTGLVIGILPRSAKILPSMTARQQRVQAILAAVTLSISGDTCKGMNVTDGMICLVNPITERPRAHWNHCLNWIASKGVACVIDPQTGYVKTVALPDALK
jgi:NADPH:quinone reductase-like Zn-dependent oxidoreductase